VELGRHDISGHSQTQDLQLSPKLTLKVNDRQENGRMAIGGKSAFPLPQKVDSIENLTNIEIESKGGKGVGYRLVILSYRFSKC
jgi:hypothetical protein